MLFYYQKGGGWMIEIELFGRQEIFIPRQEITEETLPKILARAMAIHSTNAAQNIIFGITIRESNLFLKE